MRFLGGAHVGERECDRCSFLHRDRWHIDLDLHICDDALGRKGEVRERVELGRQLLKERLGVLHTHARTLLLQLYFHGLLQQKLQGNFKVSVVATHRPPRLLALPFGKALKHAPIVDRGCDADECTQRSPVLQK